MTVKSALLAAALVPMLASAQLPLDAPTVGDNHPMVAKVRCMFGSGSAFRVGKDYWISVKHVTSQPGCSVDGEPISELWQDPKRDFSIFRLAARTGRSLKIDCGGFVEGRKYRAIGHARGLNEQTSITLVATGETREGFAVLRGIFTVIPGQSGGLFQDTVTGKAVGAIAVYVPQAGISGAVSLSDTSVCANA